MPASAAPAQPSPTDPMAAFRAQASSPRVNTGSCTASPPMDDGSLPRNIATSGTRSTAPVSGWTSAPHRTCEGRSSREGSEGDRHLGDGADLSVHRAVHGLDLRRECAQGPVTVAGEEPEV